MPRARMPRAGEQIEELAAAAPDVEHVAVRPVEERQVALQPRRGWRRASRGTDPRTRRTCRRRAASVKLSAGGGQLPARRRRAGRHRGLTARLPLRASRLLHDAERARSSSPAPSARCGPRSRSRAAIDSHRLSRLSASPLSAALSDQRAAGRARSWCRRRRDLLEDLDQARLGTGGLATMCSRRAPSPRSVRSVRVAVACGRCGSGDRRVVS